MIELARIYFLACELQPPLPNHKLMRQLPPKYAELIASAAANGLASGIAGYAQLAQLYEKGAQFGIEPTLLEFKGLMTALLREEIEKREMSLFERMELSAQLVAYFRQGESFITQERLKFNTPAPPLNRFSTGFAPLDSVLGGNAVTSVVTLIASPGTGKSYLSLAIAAGWSHGSVLFYDPENGSGLMLERAQSIDVDRKPDNKEFIFGYYNPDEILEELREDPDPGRLIIMDSLHFICGTGRTPDSGAKYEKAYTTAVAMQQHCKLVLITTQVKRGADGDSIDAGAASSCIERHSGAQIHLSKGELLPDGATEYRMFCSKNRYGPGGLEIKFAFDYFNAICRYLVEDLKYSEEAMEQMEYLK